MSSFNDRRTYFHKGQGNHDRAETTGTDTETENGRGNTDPEPENHHQCHHATKMEGEKQKLAEKAAREAELTAKAQARQALSIYLNLAGCEAVNTLKPRWPGLFDGDTPDFWPAVSGTCYWKTWRSGISRLA